MLQTHASILSLPGSLYAYTTISLAQYPEHKVATVTDIP